MRALELTFIKRNISTREQGGDEIVDFTPLL